ncbi:hypothetical protein FRC08_000789 [Ceratobasidium sp. 394]|nr:hypothetical protein FRC08_000789 [Ceratobasidium sp. 394]KAG9093383.1 hypothetical protein FS749_014476 [Ceratobasidium sp. UAMH 11750]
MPAPRGSKRGDGGRAPRKTLRPLFRPEDQADEATRCKVVENEVEPTQTPDDGANKLREGTDG